MSISYITKDDLVMKLKNDEFFTKYNELTILGIIKARFIDEKMFLYGGGSKYLKKLYPILRKTYSPLENTSLFLK